MMSQYTSIKPADQADVLSSFWMMLLAAEREAEHTGSQLDKTMVNAWYKQWNRITGSNNKPRWADNANT